MNHRVFVGLSVFSALVVLLLLREIVLRFRLRYEYRWDSFSVLGPFGRQLFQIRQSEIESIKPARLTDGAIGAKRFNRSQFGRKIVIRARMVRTPVVISWEGEPIAGLAPEGLKPRPPRRRR